MRDRLFAVLLNAGEETGVPPIDPGTAIESILNTVYFFAGTVAVIVIIIAGYFFTTANGNAQQITRAKQAILGAGIGLVAVLMAFTITQFVIWRFTS